MLIRVRTNGGSLGATRYEKEPERDLAMYIIGEVEIADVAKHDTSQ